MAEKKQKKAAKEAAVPPAVRELQQRKRMETLCTMMAWGNEKFCKTLLADPKAALAEGLKLPARMRITITEEKANEICVSLPPKPAAGGELSDDELEAVAGGGRMADAGRWIDDNLNDRRIIDWFRSWQIRELLSAGTITGRRLGGCLPGWRSRRTGPCVTHGRPSIRSASLVSGIEGIAGLFLCHRRGELQSG